VNAGDTFVDGKYGHLWIVLSDPAADGERVVIVNFTTHSTEKEDDCIVQPGEHPFVKSKTLIQFRDAKCCRLADLETLVKGTYLKPHKPVTVDLLNRITSCASSKSHKLPKACKASLEDQGLI
jgi:hypothetical protein